jgi:hypothetical protein
MQPIRAVLVTCVLAAPAAADSVINTVVQEDFTVDYTRPSGEAETTSISRGGSGAGYHSIPTPAGKSMAVTVRGADGAVVAKGTVRDNYHYVLLPTKAGFSLVEAGAYSRSGDVFPGVVIVSALDEAFTLDLFGSSGTAGTKNAKPAPAFEAKHAIKLPTAESSYKASLTLAGGKHDAGTATTGRYQIIHRGYDGKPVISDLGYIEPVKTPAKR